MSTSEVEFRQDLRRLDTLDAAGADGAGENAHSIMRSFGGWADRTDVDELLTEIYADREAATGREVTL